MDRTEIVDWLLESDNPPVRLLTLTRLLGRPGTADCLAASGIDLSAIAG